MKGKNKILYFLVLLGFASSCTQVIDVSIPSEEQRVVIQGLVTTQTQPFKVKVTKTITLGTNNSFAAVDNAIVVIADNVGNRDTLQWKGSGNYQTIVDKTGVVGRTYMLTVKVDGTTYSAKDELFAVTPIDSLYALYKTAASEPGITEDGYYLYFISTDPQNEKNYYLYNVYRNGQSVLNPSQIGVSDDKFLNAIISARLPGKFALGDHARFEWNSISENAYNFYEGLSNQLQNDGGFFSTPPANAPTNLSNGALGFFQASDIRIDSLVVH